RAGDRQEAGGRTLRSRHKRNALPDATRVSAGAVRLVAGTSTLAPSRRTPNSDDRYRQSENPCGHDRRRGRLVPPAPALAARFAAAFASRSPPTASTIAPGSALPPPPRTAARRIA